MDVTRYGQVAQCSHIDRRSYLRTSQADSIGGSIIATVARVHSVNVGAVREFEYKGRPAKTLSGNRAPPVVSQLEVCKS